MKIVGKRTPILLVAVLGAMPVFAGTLTRIAWTSHNGAYINDTIVDQYSSPLPFTTTNSLAEPFLNAADSTISLSYGSYYAISFRGFGAHTGTGTVSFVLDGVTTNSQNVTFPHPTLPSGVFANFSLPGGDTVTVSATGLAADRIRIIADGGGLFPDGTPDAFYLFTYAQAVPQITIVPAASGLATISWTPDLPGYRLQESMSLSPAAWTNSPSGQANPIVVSIDQQSRFYRLIKP